MMTQPDSGSPLRSLFDSVLDKLSDQVAGPGGRRAPGDLLPGTDDPLEGTVPEEYLPDVATFEWFDPTVWAQTTPENVSDIDLSAVAPATGPGKAGRGLDWFRAGEAPNNFVNRNNPLYQARREFAVAIDTRIAEQFGVTSQGSAGHYRAPHPSHAAPGGPSANSDHYSGGAVDYFGSKEELNTLREWLITQPFVSFVRWQSESHFDHLHVSYDLGWVAQNFYQGREVPQVAGGSTSTSTATGGLTPGAPRQPRKPPRDPRQGIQVADDPNMNRVV